MNDLRGALLSPNALHGCFEPQLAPQQELLDDELEATQTPDSIQSWCMLKPG